MSSCWHQRDRERSQYSYGPTQHIFVHGIWGMKSVIARFVPKDRNVSHKRRRIVRRLPTFVKLVIWTPRQCGTLIQTKPPTVMYRSAVTTVIYTVWKMFEQCSYVCNSLNAFSYKLQLLDPTSVGLIFEFNHLVYEVFRGWVYTECTLEVSSLLVVLGTMEYVCSKFWIVSSPQLSHISSFLCWERFKYDLKQPCPVRIRVK